MSLYDGRDRAQNGWFVLRTLVPSGKTQGAVVWHIHPNLIPNWTRPPMIAHSQAGYAPDFPKVAVLELDPDYDAPKTAKVLRLEPDGSYKQVFEGPITEPTPWLRYRYAKFDFSVGEGAGAVRDRVWRRADALLSRLGRMSTATRGSRAWMDFLAWRWITCRCGKAIGCGTGFRIWTMRGRLRRTSSILTAIGWGRIWIRRSSRASIFLG